MVKVEGSKILVLVLKGFLQGTGMINIKAPSKTYR